MLLLVCEIEWDYSWIFFSFQLRENENKALAEKIANTSAEKAEQMVFAALQQRHMRERVELEELFNNEVDSARAFAKAHAEESRQLERDSLLGKQDQVSTSYFFCVIFVKASHV